MNNPPENDDDRWMLLRKPRLDDEVMRQIALLSDQELPRLKCLGIIYVSLEDVALNKISQDSVRVEVESQDFDWIGQRAAELGMVAVTGLYKLFSEFGVAEYCDLNCENPKGCCLEPVWASTREVILSHIAGFIIRANLVEVVLDEVLALQAMDPLPHESEELH